MPWKGVVITMTHKNTRAFFGAFLVSLILIGAVCGFMVVEIRTERYMPGNYPPMFLVSNMDEKGADIAWMGHSYRIDAQTISDMQMDAWKYRAMLPGTVRLAGALAVKVLQMLNDADR